MSSWTLPSSPIRIGDDRLSDPDRRSLLIAIGLALAFVLLTRWPVARSLPMEPDEFIFVGDAAVRWFPTHHTLFKTLGRLSGLVMGDAYRGFVALDMISSALALVSLWWWLRAVVSPRTAAAGTLLLGVGPDFWGYGAMAGNYTAIVLVGSFLMGVAIRGHRRPESWQPIAAAAVLALGTGYRTDLGLLWMPVFLVILWQHRWKPAMVAGLGFAAINLAWAGAMLHEVGGWTRYVEETSAFAHSAGTLNSYWHLGVVDGPLRYSVKLAMALVWTLGPALLFVPRGLWRLRRARVGAIPRHPGRPQRPARPRDPPPAPLRRRRLLLPLRPGPDGDGRARRRPGRCRDESRAAARLRPLVVPAPRAGRRPGRALPVLSDGLLGPRLAGGLRPLVLPAHPPRPESADAAAVAVGLADGQFEGAAAPAAVTE